MNFVNQAQKIILNCTSHVHVVWCHCVRHVKFDVCRNCTEKKLMFITSVHIFSMRTCQTSMIYGCRVAVFGCRCFNAFTDLLTNEKQKENIFTIIGLKCTNGKCILFFGNKVIRSVINNVCLYVCVCICV